MVNSIQANQLSSLINNNQSATSKQMNVSVDTEKAVAASSTKEEETAEGSVATSKDGDTVTISLKAQKTFTAQSKSSVISEDEGYTDSTAAALSSAAAGAGISSTTQVQQQQQATSAAVSSASSSSSDESDLSSYSVSELKQMLQSGEITQAEYNEEIASRQKNDSEEETDAETTATAVNSAEATEE